MDLFDKKGGLKDTVGNHPTSPIPTELSWDSLGTDILAGVKQRKKRRRFLFWWWGVGLSCLIFGTFFLWTSFQERSVSALPIAIGKENKVALDFKKQTTNTIKKVSKVPMENENMATLTESFRVDRKPSNSTNISTLSVTKTKISPFPKEQKSIRDAKNDGANEQFLKQNINKQPVRDQLPIVEKLPILPFLVKVDTVAELPTLTLPKAKQKNKTWSIEVAVGVNNWQLGNKLKVLDQPLQTPLVGWQTDLRIARKITNQFSVKMGIGFQNLRFKSQNTSVREIMVFQPNTIDTIRTSTLTGQQTFVYTDSVSALQTRDFQHFNRHQSLQIPLLLSYQIGHKRWQISLQTGVSAQFFHQSEGRVAIAEGEIIDLPSVNLYPKFVRWSMLTEMQLAYQTRQNLLFFARLNREQHLKNWYNSDFLDEQKPIIISANVGVSWRIDKKNKLK